MEGKQYKKAGKKVVATKDTERTRLLEQIQHWQQKVNKRGTYVVLLECGPEFGVGGAQS